MRRSCGLVLLCGFVLAVLGGPYGRVLENQELVLRLEKGGFFVHYHGLKLPIALKSCARILAHRIDVLEENFGPDHPSFRDLWNLIADIEHLPGPGPADPAKAGESLRAANQVGVVRAAKAAVAGDQDEVDALLSVKLTDGKQVIFMATAQGQAIRFQEDDVRPMGRGAHGVIGMRLQGDDAIVEMDSLSSREGSAPSRWSAASSLLQRTPSGSIQSGGTIPAEVHESIKILNPLLGGEGPFLDEGEQHMERATERNARVPSCGADSRIIGEQPSARGRGQRDAVAIRPRKARIAREALSKGRIRRRPARQPAFLEKGLNPRRLRSSALAAGLQDLLPHGIGDDGLPEEPEGLGEEPDPREEDQR